MKGQACYSLCVTKSRILKFDALLWETLRDGWRSLARPWWKGLECRAV